MVTRRERFERVYALTEAVAPADLIRESTDEEAEDFLLTKMVAWGGLTRLNGINQALKRTVSAAEVAAWRARRLADGTLVEVRAEGWSGTQLALGADADLLRALDAGVVPAAWTPLETTSDEEVVWLAPLDPVSARGRAKTVFGFDYTWEIYTPVHKRRWGPHTMPILWGDRLVARVDPRLDRATGVARDQRPVAGGPGAREGRRVRGGDASRRGALPRVPRGEATRRLGGARGRLRRLLRAALRPLSPKAAPGARGCRRPRRAPRGPCRAGRPGGRSRAGRPAPAARGRDSARAGPRCRPRR